MKADKAIEILSDRLQFLNYPDLIDYKQANLLGIEALKRIQSQRRNIIPINQPPLPGETF